MPAAPGLLVISGENLVAFQERVGFAEALLIGERGNRGRAPRLAEGATEALRPELRT